MCVCVCVCVCAPPHTRAVYNICAWPLHYTVLKFKWFYYCVNLAVGGVEHAQKQAEVLTPSDERGLAVYRSYNMIGLGKEALPVQLRLGVMNDWQEKEKLPVAGRGAGLMAAAELCGSLDHSGPLPFHPRPQLCQEKLLFLPPNLLYIFFIPPNLHI